MNKVTMLKRYLSLISLLAFILLASCTSVQYSQQIAEQKSIPQVAVKVSYKDDGIYQVEVANNFPHTIALQWNSSAYVNTNGKTIRLIHIESLDAFPETTPVEQKPVLIAPSVRLKMYFVGESWIDFARRGVTPRPKDTTSTAKIYLAFEIQGKKVYWKGEVNFLPEKN